MQTNTYTVSCSSAADNSIKKTIITKLADFQVTLKQDVIRVSPGWISANHETVSFHFNHPLPDRANSDLSSLQQFTEKTARKIVLFGRELTLNDLTKIAEKWPGLFTQPRYMEIVKPAEQLPAGVAIYLEELPEHESVLSLANEMEIEVVAVQDAPQLHEPGVLVMDMDSTAIEIECIDEMAVLAGVGEEVANVTAQAMRGELDFAQSLIKRVAALEGAGENIVTDLLDTIPLMPGLSHLVRSLKAHQWKVVIASGGFLPFTEHLQQMLGLDATFANDLEIIDGKLTGKVNGEIVDAQKKADVVLAVAEQAGIPRQQTVAMGDGANDLIMMDAAGLGVAFHAKPLVQSKAKTSISHGGLDQLLYLLES